MKMNESTISRSAHEALFRCGRYRYLAYEHLRGLPISLPDGQTLIHIGGLAPMRTASALVTGTCVHLAFTTMLSRIKQWEEMAGQSQTIDWMKMRHAQAWEHEIQVAVSKALQEFDAAASKGISYGLDPAKDPEMVAWYEQEQRALVEALGWVAGLRLVPELASRYKIVDVEREERMELGPGLRPFAARADALLEDRQTGDLSVFSLKTAAAHGRMEEARFKRDVQGLSEAIAIESRLNQNEPSVCDDCGGVMSEHEREYCLDCRCGGRWKDAPPSQKISTIQMAILLKGIRRQNESANGRKEHSSPLVRAYRMKDELTGIEQWAWSFYIPKVNQKTGETYKGQISKDYKITPAWEYPGGIKAWVLALDRGEIQPELPESRDVLLQAIALPEPWGRAEDEMVDWLEQFQASEQHLEVVVQAANDAIALGDAGSLRRILNKNFPQNRHSCVQFNSSCQFDGSLCFNSQGLERLMSGMVPEGFTARIDHHGEEGEE